MEPHLRLDSYKIAALPRGGNLPYAYVYPRAKRASTLGWHLFCRNLYGSGSLGAVSTPEETRFTFSMALEIGGPAPTAKGKER